MRQLRSLARWLINGSTRAGPAGPAPVASEPVEVRVVVGGEVDHAVGQVDDDPVRVAGRAARARVHVELAVTVGGGQLALEVPVRAAREVALAVRPVVPAAAAGVVHGLPRRVGRAGCRTPGDGARAEDGRV